jgi:hypothetical protein
VTKFHAYWALDQVLELLRPGTRLKAVTVEGIASETPGPDQPKSEGVDCGAYFGGTTLEKADAIDLKQLKYSSSNRCGSGLQHCQNDQQFRHRQACADVCEGQTPEPSRQGSVYASSAINLLPTSSRRPSQRDGRASSTGRGSIPMSLYTCNQCRRRPVSPTQTSPNLSVCLTSVEQVTSHALPQRQVLSRT